MTTKTLNRIAVVVAAITSLTMFAWLAGIVELPDYLPGPLALVILVAATVGLFTEKKEV